MLNLVEIGSIACWIAQKGIQFGQPCITSSPVVSQVEIVFTSTQATFLTSENTIRITPNIS